MYVCVFARARIRACFLCVCVCGCVQECGWFSDVLVVLHSLFFIRTNEVEIHTLNTVVPE
jgi:hypothetical protein